MPYDGVELLGGSYAGRRSGKGMPPHAPTSPVDADTLTRLEAQGRVRVSVAERLFAGIDDLNG